MGLRHYYNIFVVHNKYVHLCYDRNVVIAQAFLQSPMDRLDLRHISSKIYDGFVVLELEYIYTKAIEQSYLISEMNWLRNQSMGRIGRLGRVTF